MIAPGIYLAARAEQRGLYRDNNLSKKDNASYVTPASKTRGETRCARNVTVHSWDKTMASRLCKLLP
jgi:hypothetical protein